MSTSTEKKSKRATENIEGGVNKLVQTEGTACMTETWERERERQVTCRGVGAFTAVDTQSLVGFRKNR